MRLIWQVFCCKSTCWCTTTGRSSPRATSSWVPPTMGARLIWQMLVMHITRLVYNYRAVFTARDIVMEPSYDGWA